MTIKLAFSTVATPEWTLEEVAARAKEWGYDGVELRTLGPGGTGLACDPALSDGAKVREVFAAAGVKPVCLSTSTMFHHRDTTSQRQAQRDATRDLELAAAIGAPALRVYGYEVATGQDRRSVLRQIAANVQPVADRASDLGLQLLFENAGSFAVAKDWWWLLEMIDSDAVGLCWNVANAAAAGEPPSVSVPTLHSRIKLAKVKDTRIGEGSGFVPLGEGTVGIHPFIKRLLGIGYDGYVTVEWDRVWLPSLTPAEEYLPDAQKRLKGWFDANQAAQDEALPKPKEKAAAH